MENNIYERNYQKLLPFIEDMIGTAKQHKRYTTGTGMMPLVVERLTSKNSEGNYLFSLSHYYTQNGDLMADPDMQLEVNPEAQTIEALTYRQDGLGIFQEVYYEQDKNVYVRTKLKKQLNEFLEMWLTNIHSQGYVLEEKE